MKVKDGSVETWSSHFLVHMLFSMITFILNLFEYFLKRICRKGIVNSPVQVKTFVSVYIDRDSDRDSVRDRDKNNREKNYIDRVRDAK